MLTIKAPIAIKCGRAMASSHESFAQRILGNYQLAAAKMEREDLLHVVMAPPEVYIGGGALTSIVEDTRVRNIREMKLTMINNLLNRIAVADEVKLSYQDRVYITDVLQRLGVTNVSYFMKQVSELKQESRNVEELTELYWNHMEELNRTVEQYGNLAGESRLVEQSLNRESTLHLHEEIMNRLQTGVLYQILSNFYSVRTEAQYINAQELNFAEQQRTVSRILLNRLETETTGTQVPFVYRHENYYEENAQEGDTLTENAVNSRLTSAVLLNLADSLIQNLSVRQIRGSDVWIHLENSLYQSAENTFRRMLYRTEGQNVRLSVRQDAKEQTLKMQEREITSLRELLKIAGTEAQLPGGRPASVQRGEALPEEGMRPADIRYGEIASETIENTTSLQMLTERIKEIVTADTGLPGRSAGFPENGEEWKTAQTETEQREKAEEKSHRGTEAPRARRRTAPKSREEAPQEERAGASAPVELTLLAEGSADSGFREEGSPGKAVGSSDEELLQAQIAQTLKQYFSSVYPSPGEPEESLHPVSLSYSRLQEQENAAESQDRRDVLPESSGGDTVRSILERWQAPEEKKAATEIMQSGSDFTVQESLIYPEREPETGFMEEREQIRERTERLVRGEDHYHIRQDAAEQTFYSVEEASSEEQAGLQESDEERLERELQEINRRNVENYERYQQLVKIRQQEEAGRKQKEKPSLLKMREESLRALENPQQVLEEHLGRTPEEATPPSKVDRKLIESLPEETRVLYQRLEELQESRRSAGRQGEMEQSRDISRLARDIRLIERENTNVTQEVSEDRHEIREVLKSVTERSQDYGQATFPPGSQTEYSHQELSLVHKSTESTLDEETLQELLAQNQTIRRDVETTKRVEENVQTQTTSVQRQTSRTEVEEREDIERLIQRGLRQQMGALSDQIYTKLERRLASEKRRRGY